MFQPTFFDMAGNNMFFGGAERYMLDLADLLVAEGFDPILIQMSDRRPWIRHYGRLRVVGLACGADYEAFRSQIADLVPKADLAVFSPFTLNPVIASKDGAEPQGIGISHGIYWDHRQMQSAAQLDLIIRHAAACKALVSVDTSTINWFRGTNTAIAERFIYVPNYVDREQFAPVDRPPDGRLVILYPRRLYGPRGYDIVLQVAPGILERHRQVVLEFCGKGDPDDLARMRPLRDAFGDRVRLYNLPPERMHEAYRGADIVLIPTVASEGTSLSCLEAMASGKAIIATHVGGLPDLVIDGYNGLLIEPRADRLEAALERMISDATLRATCGRRARDISEAFGIEKWRERWRRVLAAEAPPFPKLRSTQRRWAILHPATNGIDFDVMRQRPQHLLRAFAQAGVLSLFQNWSRPRVASGIPLLQVLEKDDDLYPCGQVVYLYYPFHALELKRFDDATVLYDVLDDPVIHADEAAKKCHEQLLRRADIVITSSRVLHEQLLAVRPDVLLVPNGVWPEDFAGLAERPRASRAAPCVGYAGAIAEWFDFGLMREVAAALPDCEFRLAGICTRPAELQALLKACPNIHYAGLLTYDQLPKFYADIDVGIIPFVLNEITHKVSPLKMFEYLAGGAPRSGNEHGRDRRRALLTDRGPDELCKPDQGGAGATGGTSLRSARPRSGTGGKLGEPRCQGVAGTRPPDVRQRRACKGGYSLSRIMPRVTIARYLAARSEFGPRRFGITAPMPYRRRRPLLSFF
ncbi:glycosyltransferase family 4 protein [Crenalkalicoccus roseus]|uniref:glycosyltransferase family 4 protein n=1 Tax=Crenalkalicoccus roseus TaxID=1485588 RepID=UPI00130547BB|nr:glycosyltransferase [Crenalkalicoccus roseus]